MPRPIVPAPITPMVLTSMQVSRCGFFAGTRAGPPALFSERGCVASPYQRALPPLKFWRPLLEEGANTLAAILGKIACQLMFSFRFQRALQRLPTIAKQDALCRANRQRRPVGQLPRERRHFTFELRRGNNTVQDSEAQCGF